MQAAQQGDRVQIHYVRRFQDGSTTTSRDGVPIEVTIGVEHPRLPGLGLSLVGMLPGLSTRLQVPAEEAFGPSDPSRVHRLAKTRFAKDEILAVGKWVKFVNQQGRNRKVRILEIKGGMVVVDTNRRWAGQTMELEVELVAIQGRNSVQN